jgi:glyoxylase-like metal-dependent hydrolase (beta-lactamase superfamily II)/rhodanese-related sulfurtransferase
MIFKQFYLGCLAHASYLIADGGEAAVVDPQRDVDQYIAEAERCGAKIRWVIETHLHADFVSGHRELAARTGAEIVFGARAEAAFPHRAVRDGDTIRVGSVELRALETPGHTPESISWLVIRDGRVERVLTGDTLFIGDVGRPDLASGRGYTPQMMASMMYDSLHRTLLALPDDVEVWPAHGAGSACGRNISKETSTTIGVQRRTNYALRPMAREEFVSMLTTDIAAAPQYFSHDAEMNRRGARALEEIAPPPLAAADVAALLERGAIPLDVRDTQSFAAGHIPRSVNIGLDGQYASWCGTLFSPAERLVIVADGEERSREAIMRLARVGMENVAGYVDRGILGWTAAGKPSEELPQMDVAELRDSLGNMNVIDVRRPAEYVAGHVPVARNVPLNELPQRIRDIRSDAPLAVICASGYRSSIASSLLARTGVAVTNVIGGTSAWMQAGYAVAPGDAR